MKKRTRILALVLTLILLFTSAVPTFAASASPAEGTYEIVSILKGNRVIGATSGKAVTRTRVAGGRNEDRFVITSIGKGYYTIKNVKTGNVLDVTAGVKEIQSAYSLFTPSSYQKAVNLYNTNGGIRTSFTKYTGAAGQKWQFESAGSGCYYLKCFPISAAKSIPVYLAVAKGKAGENVALTATVRIKKVVLKSGKINVSFGPSSKNNANKFKLSLVESKAVTTKKAAFQKDKRWKNGTSWKAIRPKLSRANGTGCYALCADYTKYVYGKDDPKSGKAFTNTNDIKSGDILYVKKGNEPHWIIVLERNGSTLTTMERYSNKTSVVTGRYNVKNGKLVNSKGAACPKQLVKGYHFT